MACVTCTLSLDRWNRFCPLRSGFELGEDARQQVLNGFREVFGHMEPIGHLNGLRSTTRGGAGILAASIAADMRNFGMGLQPGHCGFCLTVWQQINYLMGVQVHQDGAERSATQKREIIEAQILNRLCWLGRQSHDSANNRHPGGRYAKTRGQPRAQSATGG
jgi:hypothetical protein